MAPDGADKIGARAEMAYEHILTELHKAWTDRREDVEASALGISKQLGDMMGGAPGGDLDPSLLGIAFSQFASRFEW